MLSWQWLRGWWQVLRFRRAERRRVRQVHGRLWVWKAMRIGGGGRFDTPPLLRTDALDYVTRRGTHQIAHVDDENKLIFYRSL